MTLSDFLTVTGTVLSVWALSSGNIAVNLRGVEIREGNTFINAVGVGVTLDDAVKAYFGKIEGELLVVDGREFRAPLSLAI